MNTKIIKSTLPLAFLLLVAMIGLAVAGGKAPPSDETKTATVGQEVKPDVQTSSAAPASGEQINWQVISSGGTNDGSSTSFRLSTTVGQTATGYGESESFGLSHGFWQELGGGGGTCCLGEIRGNVDNDPGDAIDISDLVFLVDYMFTGGPAPTCWEEANIDGSGDGPPDGSEDIDISDLVYLVDFMFNEGPAPLPCP